MTGTEDGVEGQVVVRLLIASDQVVDGDGLVSSVVPVLIAWPRQLGHPVQSTDSAAKNYSTLEKLDIKLMIKNRVIGSYAFRLKFSKSFEMYVCEPNDDIFDQKIFPNTIPAPNKNNK